MGTYAIDIGTMSIGLLLVRIVIGGIMAAHGTAKSLGWFGGHRLRETGQFFEQAGFHPGAAFAAAAAVTEIISGLLVAVGFLGPIGPALMVSVMLVAMLSAHLGQGLLAPKGIELPLLYAAGAFGLALTGFGQYSLDALFGFAGRWSAGFTWIVLVLGVAGAFVNLAVRRRPTVAVQAG